MILCKINKGTANRFSSANIINGSLSLNRYTSNATANVFGCVSSSELMFSIDKSTTQNTVEVGDRLYALFYDEEEKEEDNFGGNGSRKTFSLSHQSMDLMVYLDGVLQRLLTDYSVTFTTVDNFTVYTAITFNTAPADGSTISILYTPFPTSRTVGTFIVTKVETLQRSFNVTCLDPMIELDTVADLSGIAFPMTAMELLQIIETRSLMQIDYDRTLPNPSLNKPVFDSDVTWRQVLSKVCECMGAVAYYDTALRVRGFQTTTATYTDANYFNAELTGEAYDIDIEATNDATASIIALDGSNLVLRIVGNEFLAGKTQTGLDNIADAIKQKIGTVEWYGGRAVILPEIPFVMPNQIVTIDGKAFPVMEVTHGINENVIIESKINADNIDYNNEPQKQLEKVKEQGRHFFYRDDSGIHITMVENDYNTGKNVLIDSDSMDFRDGRAVLASFGAETRIGEQGKGGVAFNDTETVFYDFQGSRAGSIAQGITTNKVKTEDGQDIAKTSWEELRVEFTLNDTPVESDYLIAFSGQFKYNNQTLDFDSALTSTVLEAQTPVPFLNQVVCTFSYDVTTQQFTATVAHTSGATITGDAELSVSITYAYVGASPVYLFGLDLVSTQPYSFIVGQYNEDNYNLFAVGDGTDDSNRHNIFEIGLGEVLVDGQFSVTNGITTVGEIWTDEIRASGVITAEQNIVFDTAGRGLYALDRADFSYPLIRDNGSNLWIGATQASAQHHAGATYISSGYNVAQGTGNESIYVSVPNATNTGASQYAVYHAGNLTNATTSANGLMASTDKEKLDDIGTMVNISSGSVTIGTATGWQSTGKSFTLSAGTWIVDAGCAFANNATGRRGVCVSASDGGSQVDYLSVVTSPAVSGAITYLSFTWVVKVTTSTTYYLSAVQNSGGDLSCTPRLKAVKIA